MHLLSPVGKKRKTKRACLCLMKPKSHVRLGLKGIYKDNVGAQKGGKLALPEEMWVQRKFQALCKLSHTERGMVNKFLHPERRSPAKEGEHSRTDAKPMNCRTSYWSSSWGVFSRLLFRITDPLLLSFFYHTGCLTVMTVVYVASQFCSMVP